MKNITIKITTLLIGVLFIVQATSAQTLTPTSAVSTSPAPSPTESVNEKEIQDIKDKIATKVAELREKNNKAVGGTITAISGNTIKIKSEDETQYDIKVDESLTKVYQVSTGVKKEIKKSDLTKNMYIIATGVINDKTIDANFIYQDDLFLVKSGKISEVNAADSYVKVVTTDKDNYTLDIETTTRITLLNSKTLEPERITFAKIKEGDTAHFVVKKTVTTTGEANRYSAIKILIIAQEFFVK